MEDNEWHIASNRRPKSNKPKVIRMSISEPERVTNSFVVNKPAKEIKQVQRPVKNTNVPQQHIRDDEDIHIKKVSLETQRAIQQARCARKIGEKTMSQEDLARLCSLDVAIIRHYEDGSAVVKQHELNKIGRVLNIILH